MATIITILDNIDRSELLEAIKENKNAIPTKTSQLTNDSDFLTTHQDLSDYATKAYVDEAIDMEKIAEELIKILGVAEGSEY